jgi:hypothetical protein
VLCADGDQGHAHGPFHSSPYEHYDEEEAIAFASVYSLELAPVVISSQQRFGIGVFIFLNPALSTG